MQTDDLSRRHAMWIAKNVARTDQSPLTASDIMALEATFEPRRVEAGTVLASTGSEADAVHIVRDGRVHLAIRAAGTGRQTIGIVGPGCVVGDVPILTQELTSSDAYADVDTTLLTADRTDFVNMLRESPTLSIRWATSMAQRIERQQARTVTLLTKDLAAQIATILWEFRKEEEGVWRVRMPHQTIAHLLGARRQSVSRVLGQLRREGLVQSRYGSVELTDLQGIASLAGMKTVEDLAQSA
ncbi:Crp/Fnr family transcriptional regulator [Euzebya tangerina]|uniref:Crp/Fnr family transcriptional regulator n=1 Tax=Euzebya tangerina TaxID=591198 RepID=UPI000E311EF3|nr:Crp/Fnr family transcriptional regulator [Euzebya tangerina]